MHRIQFSLVIVILFLNLPVSSQILVDLPFLQINRSNIENRVENDSSLHLIMAAERGDVDSVLVLIEKGFDVNHTTHDGVTALMYAASNGYLEVAETLTENGAKENAVPDNGITALSGACINNHYDMVLFLIQQGADTEIADIKGVTPLLYSAAYDYFEITELLLMFGADPSHTDMEGATALHAAAIYAQPDIAWLLLDYGAGINSRDDYGFTPLMMAVQLGRTEMVGYLLENNAEIRIQTKDGLSSLAIAIANNQPDIAEKLIELGADPKKKISYTDNLMNLAIWQGNEELISLMEGQRVKPNIIPDFRTMRISGNFLFNTGDFFNGIKVALEDEKYDLRLTAGWKTRPVRRAVLVEYSELWYDQLWEQRHLFFGGLFKDFPLKQSLSLNQEGFYAGINVLYSQGRYWGTYAYPDPGWSIVPSAGYYKKGSWWFYEIGYEYLDLNIREKSAHRISFGAGIRFQIQEDPVIYRITNW